MASSSRSQPGTSNPQPYRIHVSQKYLDLTRRKLELTRLPRDPPGAAQQQDFGVSKSDVDYVLDQWTQAYDWRAQETYYNDRLPQFRATINKTRLHFVHKRSQARTAVPILFIHGWPESFLTVTNTIDALCNPVTSPSSPDRHTQAFHVVAPSIPGFGFSDPVAEEENNMRTTAWLFHALMISLGYSRYMVHGSGWAFRVCRMLAIEHSNACIAIHTVNPDIPAPGSNLFGFGYAPQHLSTFPLQATGLMPTMTPRSTIGLQLPVPQGPQSTAYALADSPAGLLAVVMEAVQPPSFAHGQRSGRDGFFSAVSSPVFSRSPTTPRSEGTGTSVSASPLHSSHGHSPQSLEGNELLQVWTPTALITWTMLYWLPGPETALRWLTNSAAMESLLWTGFCAVPLGVTHFRDPSIPPNGTNQTPPQWAEAYFQVVMLQSREGRARFPAWERPAEVVADIRGLASIVGAAFQREPDAAGPRHTHMQWQAP